MNKKWTLINASLIFVIASILETNLHEAAHFVAAIFYHASDISLHHNYVNYDNKSIDQNAQIGIAAAGPLFSLILGIVAHIACAKYHKRNLLFLFFVYLSAFAYIGFAGYLMVAPFFVYGDTGFVLNALHFPIWLVYLFALAAAVFLILIMRKMDSYFLEMSYKDVVEDKKLRKQFLNFILVFPLLLGTVMTTLLHLPVFNALSLINPIASPFGLMWGYGFVTNRSTSGIKLAPLKEGLGKPSILLLVLFVLTIIFNRMLVQGIYH